MKKSIKRHWFELCTSLAMLFFVIIGVSVVFGYMHRTNDDVLLRSLVSGNYTGVPESKLFNMMFPLGIVYRVLYSLFPKVSWYDLLVTSLHYFCWYAITIRIASVFESKTKKFMALAFSYCVLLILDLSYLVLNQYTILAGVCATTAILWLVLLDASETEGMWIHIVLIVTMMTLALWIREEVFLMAMPIGACILIFQYLSHHKDTSLKKTCCKLQLWILFLVLSIGGLSFLVNDTAMSDKEWRYFLRYNAARTEIFDYYNLAPYNQYSDVYAREGIGEAGYEVVRSMSLALMPELDASKMERLADLSKSNKKLVEQYYSVYRKTLYSFFDTLFNGDVQPMKLITLLMCIVVLFHMWKKRNLAGYMSALLVVLYGTLFSSYFLWKGRFPDRVSFVLYSMILAFGVGLLLVEIKKQKQVYARKMKRERFWILAGLLVVGFVLTNVGMYQYRRVSDEVNRYQVGIEQWKRIEEYACQNSNNTYLVKSNLSGLSGDYMNISTEEEPENILLLGTWMSESPHYKVRSNNLNLNRVVDDLVTKDNVYLLQLENESLTWLTEYYSERGTHIDAMVTDMIHTEDGVVNVIKLYLNEGL